MNLPQGFVLDSQPQTASGVPDGFVLDQGQNIPQGFVLDKQRQMPKQPEPTGIDRAQAAVEQFGQGMTFGFADELQDRMAAAGTTIGQNIRSLWTDEKTPDYAENLKNTRKETSDRLNYQREAMPVLSTTANIAGGLATGVTGASTKAGAATGNFLRSGNLLTRMAKGAGAGAASGGLYGAGIGEDGGKLASAKQGAVFGGAVGGALPVLGAAASGVKSTLVPKIEDATAKLAKRAQEFGIPLRMDQISPTRARNTIQKISQEIPGSGVDEFEDVQRRAFTRAVSKTIGLDTDDLSGDAINSFLEKTSGTFNRLVGNREIRMNMDDTRKIALLRKTVDKTLDITARDAKILKNEIKDISEQLGENFVTGAKLANIRSDLLTKSTTARAGRDIYTKILDTLDDITKKNLTKEGAEELAQARRHWRNFKTIEPLLEEAENGILNPTKLLARVKSSKYIKASRSSVGEDDLIDLARIGKQFLPKKGGSDTFQKSAIGVGLLSGGAGLAMNPIGTVAAAAAAPVANRALQKTNMSQRLVRLAIENAGKQQGLKGVSTSALPLLGQPTGR